MSHHFLEKMKEKGFWNPTTRGKKMGQVILADLSERWEERGINERKKKIREEGTFIYSLMTRCCILNMFKIAY